MDIKLPYKRLGVPELENILLKHWHKSLRSTLGRIRFDLSTVEYLDLPQMCFLLMWVERLLSEHKHVELCFQNRQSHNDVLPRVFRVMYNHGFLTCLSQYPNLALTPSIREPLGTTTSEHAEDSPIVHLTSFGSRLELREFISTMAPSAPDPALLLAVSDRELLTRSGVRDVFLKELGLNVFDHADGAPAFIAVNRKSRQHLSYSGNANPIRNFAENSTSHEYIQVVVADQGPGIARKLGATFAADHTAHQALDPRLESSIVEYAFWKEVTSKVSRTIEELLEPDENDEALVPPTGLYFVWNLVREQRGLLYVRTGRTIWATDFSSGREVKVGGQDLWRSHNKISRPIIDIPGTTVVAYIPIDSTGAGLQRALPIGARSDSSVRIREYINVKALLLQTPLPEEKANVAALLSQIRLSSKKLTGDDALLIDCEEWDFSAKYLYKILIYAMYMQGPSRFIAFADFPPNCELGLAARGIEAIAKQMPQLAPVSVYDSATGQITLLGLGDRHRSPGTESGGHSLSAQTIRLALIERRRHYIRETILRHFQQDEKVFLPSRTYISGYFELADLTGHPYYARRLASEIASRLPASQFVAIVTTGGNLTRLASELAVRIRLTKDDVFTAEEGPRPISAIPAIASRLVAASDGLLLVLADVIVTGQSTLMVASTFGCRTIVASVVGPQGQTVPSAKNIVARVAVVEHAFQAFPEKPARWMYEEIRLVDPVTHKLIRSGPVAADTLLPSGVYLKDWVIHNGAVRRGHYFYSDVHVNYFFHTYTICEKYSDAIMEAMRADIARVLQLGGDVSHIVYPENNQAAEVLCTSLQMHLGGHVLHLPRLSDPESTRYSSASSTVPKDKASTMVFVDTAATTSQTLQYAMEMASALGAERVLVYIVINRISGRWPAAFEHVGSYRGVEVRVKSLVRVQLPAYTEKECPLCRRRALLDTYTNRTVPVTLRNLLRRTSAQLMPRSIKELREAAVPQDSHERATLCQVQLRDKIESDATSVTYTAQKELLALIVDAQRDRELAAGITACFALEGEELLDSRRYEQLLSPDFRSALFDLAVSVGVEGRQPVETRADAIWVASLCDYQRFLEAGVELVSGMPSDKIIEAVVAATVIYSSRSNAQRCCEALDRTLLAVQQCQSRQRTLESATKALREAIGYFRFRPETQGAGDRSYSDSYRALSLVIEQPGRSHTDIRRAFDACLRIVSPEDVGDVLPRTYLGESGLFHTLNERILPALHRLRSEHDEASLLDVGYLTREGSESLVSDLRELDEHFRGCLLRIADGTLSEELWRQERDRIRTVGERVRIGFLTKDSVLQDFLRRFKCSIGSVANSVIESLRPIATEKHLHFKIDMAQVDDVVIVPPYLVTDVLTTVLDNAIRYSERHTDIVLQLFLDERGININTQSSPHGVSAPRFLPGHGLDKTSAILKRFDGDIRIDDGAYATDRMASVTISLPTERKVLGHES